MSTTTTTKERPILCCEPMVTAILDGTKTQTRRIVKPQPKNRIIRGDDGQFYDADCVAPGVLVRCPYGSPGDRLWVRETFQKCACKACRAAWPKQGKHGVTTREGYHGPSGAIFTPSIFMPRWASRITLEVKSVRVERVQDISEADAVAEGCVSSYSSATVKCITDNGASFSVHPGYVHGIPKIGDAWLGGKVVVAQRIEPQIIATAKRNYITLWNTINGPKSWAESPWVWVVEFARIGGVS